MNYFELCFEVLIIKVIYQLYHDFYHIQNTRVYRCHFLIANVFHVLLIYLKV